MQVELIPERRSIWQELGESGGSKTDFVTG